MSSSFQPRAFTSSGLIGRNSDAGMREETYFSDFFSLFSFFPALISDFFSCFSLVSIGGFTSACSDFFLGFAPDSNSFLGSSPASAFFGAKKPVFLPDFSLSDFSMLDFLFFFGNAVSFAIICFRAPHFSRFPVRQVLELFSYPSFFSGFPISSLYSHHHF